MRSSNSIQRLRFALVISMCAIFLVLSLGLALSGNTLYRRTVQTVNKNYSQRTALSYIANQLRSADLRGCITVGSLNGTDALFFTQDEGEYTYVTCIYCWDGSLCELYTEAGGELNAASGEKLLPLDRLNISCEGRMITLTATTANNYSSSISIMPRCGFMED